MAQAAQGGFLVRIEDTDSTRCRADHEAAIFADLAWLGCRWPAPLRQSDHLEDYQATLDLLKQKGLIFPCGCNRRTILEAGAGQGPDGPIYPGMCKHRTMTDAKPTDALRLNLQKARAHLPDQLHFTETSSGVPRITNLSTSDVIETIGSPILRRKDTCDPAYHLACTHDDARQKVTHIIRGEDVAPSTPIHLILQHLMGWPTPIYHHHQLITDASGKRLAKIDHSRALSKYRAEGATPTDIRRMVGLPMPSSH
jgi:glutamyl-Q tRNA(Asp) synthetase